MKNQKALNINGIWVVILIFLLVAPIFSQEQIYLPVGQQKSIPAEGATDAFTVDNQIAGVRGLRNAILVIGRSVGTTAITIKYPGGRTEEKYVTVIAKDPRQVVQEAKEILGYIEGIDYKVVGDKVLMTGTVLTKRDLWKIETVIEMYPQIVPMYDDLSEEVRFGVVVNLIEYKKENIQEYEPTIPPSSGSNAVFSIDGASDFADGKGTWTMSANVLPMLSYWISNNWAKIRNQQKVTVLNGDSARVLNGGQILFQTVGNNGGIQQQWKEYGVQLGVKPELLPSGKVLLKIRAVNGDVVDGDRGQITTDEVSTREIIENGGTLVIGGFSKHGKEKNNRVVPVLGHLLPFLFSGRNSEDKWRDFLITVTVTSPPSFKVSEFPLDSEMKNR